MNHEIKIKQNDLEGKWFCPKDTCSEHPNNSFKQPIPHQITEIEIRMRDQQPLIMIRGDNTMWYGSNNCEIWDTKDDVQWIMDRNYLNRALEIRQWEVVQKRW